MVKILSSLFIVRNTVQFHLLKVDFVSVPSVSDFPWFYFMYNYCVNLVKPNKIESRENKGDKFYFKQSAFLADITVWTMKFLDLRQDSIIDRFHFNRVYCIFMSWFRSHYPSFLGSLWHWTWQHYLSFLMGENANDISKKPAN